MRFMVESNITFQPLSNYCLCCDLYCSGQRYASMELKTALSTIIRNFKIKSTKKTKDLHPVFGVVLSVQEGVHIELELRGKE
jgi:hypothetical protein